jgi:hypothetical protein
MSRLALMALAALVAIPTGVSAKEKIDPRVAASLACTSIASSEQRLACYDKAIGGLKQALEAGELVSNFERQPKKLEGIVRAAGSMGFNRYWAELDSGDRWEIISDSHRDEAPRNGAKVELRKGMMGSYWFSTPGSRDRRARFLGRRDD